MALRVGRITCDACAADLLPEAALATPVSSRFVDRSTGDACKQHLRRLCSARNSDAWATDSAPVTPVRSSICDARAADLLPEAPFATQHLRRLSAVFARPVPQICCQKQHWRRLEAVFAKQHWRRLEAEILFFLKECCSKTSFLEHAQLIWVSGESLEVVS